MQRSQPLKQVHALASKTASALFDLMDHSKFFITKTKTKRRKNYIQKLNQSPSLKEKKQSFQKKEKAVNSPINQTF